MKTKELEQIKILCIKNKISIPNEIKKELGKKPPQNILNNIIQKMRAICLKRFSFQWPGFNIIISGDIYVQDMSPWVDNVCFKLGKNATKTEKFLANELGGLENNDYIVDLAYDIIRKQRFFKDIEKELKAINEEWKAIEKEYELADWYDDVEKHIYEKSRQNKA